FHTNEWPSGFWPATNLYPSAPPAPGRSTTMTLTPSRFDMPSASRRALTSADEPAGNSTVISIGLLPGKAGSDRAQRDGMATTEPNPSKARGARKLTNRRVRMGLLSLDRCCCSYEIPLLLVRFTSALPAQVLCRCPLGRSPFVRQHFGDLDPAPLLRRQDAGAPHRSGARRVLPAPLRHPLAARRRRELLELLDKRVIG